MGFYTAQDIQTSFNVVCLLLGIGSLGMAYTFAQAGPIFGTMGLIVTCLFNIYATICLSKCFLHVPKSVETFSDLGFHLYGTFGRWAVQISQFGTCLIVPVAFLILGGRYLLFPIFHGTALNMNPTGWIILMALSLMPAVLIRSLKEAYWVMILGALTAFLSVVIAVTETAISKTWLLYEATPVMAKNVFPVFGTYALSYGAALIIPTLQREHSNPSSMPKIIIVSLTLITFLYFSIAIIGYSQFGCSSPGNLLLSMDSGIFNTMALLCMLVHIMIAFAVLLNPVLYFIERAMIIRSDVNVMTSNNIEAASSSSPSCFKPLDSNTMKEDHPDQTSMKSGPIIYTRQQQVKSFMLRISIVMIQTFFALLLQGSFIEVVDFVGATTMTTCCIILPIVFYLKIFDQDVTRMEKVFAIVVIVLCTILGIYTAIIRSRQAIETIRDAQLFAIPKSNITNAFPYCAPDYLMRKSLIKF